MQWCSDRKKLNAVWHQLERGVAAREQDPYTAGRNRKWVYHHHGLDDVPMSGPQLALQEIGLKFLGSHKLAPGILPGMSNQK